jgi:Ca-activated chloride channel family protein
MMFDAPWMLLALVPVCAVVLWGVHSIRQRLGRLAALGVMERVAALSSLDVKRRWLKLWLWAGATGCVVLALARPVWGIDAELIEARGVAVVFVLDISASMDAQDVMPSRLERAKQTAVDILDALGTGLVGVVVFAGDAYIQLPLTDDLDLARRFVLAANSSTVTRQGTAIGQALGLASEVIDERVAGDALVVLLTDGEDHQGEVLPAVEALKARGAQFFVLGYGTPEGDVIPIRDRNGAVIGVKSDQAGSIVISALDEPFLQQIAEVGGGVYQRAESSGIEAVAVIEAARELSLAGLGARLRTVSVPRFGIVLALALFLLTVEMIISERRRGI